MKKEARGMRDLVDKEKVDAHPIGQLVQSIILTSKGM
jgi:hypothetical protein